MGEAVAVGVSVGAGVSMGVGISVGASLGEGRIVGSGVAVGTAATPPPKVTASFMPSALQVNLRSVAAFCSRIMLKPLVDTLAKI